MDIHEEKVKRGIFRHLVPVCGPSWKKCCRPPNLTQLRKLKKSVIFLVFVKMKLCCSLRIPGKSEIYMVPYP